MRVLKVVIVLLIGFFALSHSSCSLMEKVGLRDATKKQEVVQQEATMDMEEARKAHYERQSKSTQQMMKESRKRARKLNRSKGKSWIERFLGL